MIRDRPAPPVVRLIAGAVGLGIDRLTEYAASLEARQPMSPATRRQRRRNEEQPWQSA